MFLSPSKKDLKLPSVKIKRHEGVKRTIIIWHNEHKIFFIHFDIFFSFFINEKPMLSSYGLFGTNFQGNFQVRSNVFLKKLL